MQEMKDSGAFYELRFGEDNLPDPWSSQIIRRIQNGFSPVLVADKAYWEANKMSNTDGDWPSSVPALAKGASRPTTLLVFKDTFSGTSVDVTWEILDMFPTFPSNGLTALLVQLRAGETPTNHEHLPTAEQGRGMANSRRGHTTGDSEGTGHGVVQFSAREKHISGGSAG